MWAAREVLARAGITKPPVDPRQLAPLQGVTDIREEPLGSTDARLTPTGSGFVISVSSFASPQRQNFSIAHEIAHTFFNHKTSSFRGGTSVVNARKKPDYRTEEALCDLAAAEMLMPEDWFRDAAASETPSIAAFQRLAGVFNTSLEATALRYAAVGGHDVQITVWRRRYGRLQPKWDRGSTVFDAHPWDLPHPSTYVEFCIGEAYFGNHLVARQEIETSCYPPRRIWIQAQGFRRGSGRYVLSLMRSAFRA